MKKILITDDDRLVCWSLEQALKKESYQVVVVETAEKALEEAKRTPFDLAIVDVVLPGMSGLELIDRMRELGLAVKTIVITGHGSREIEKEARDKGADVYVEKPFRIDEIKEMIRKALKNA